MLFYENGNWKLIGGSDKPKRKKIIIRRKESKVKSAKSLPRKAPKKIIKKFKKKTKNEVVFTGLKPPYNEIIISSLNELQTIMRLSGEYFRSSAYKKAKNTIAALKVPINSVDDIRGLPTIGKTIISKVGELITTGKINAIEKSSIGAERNFLKIYGVGPSKARELVHKHGIQSIDQLKSRPELLNEKQLIGLKYYEDLLLRIPRGEIDVYDGILNRIFATIKNEGSELLIVGSYRRGALNSGDIDILISDPNNDRRVYDRFLDKLIEATLLLEILSRGPKKCLAISKLGINPARRIDFLFTPIEEIAFAKLYFTGSQAFNTAMRTRALEYGLSMNEHKFTKKGRNPLKKPLPKSFPNEHSVFDFLDLVWKAPNERVDHSSFENK